MSLRMTWKFPAGVVCPSRPVEMWVSEEALAKPPRLPTGRRHRSEEWWRPARLLQRFCKSLGDHGVSLTQIRALLMQADEDGGLSPATLLRAVGAAAGETGCGVKEECGLLQ